MNSNKTLQTEEIKVYIENCLGINLSNRTRKRNYVYARALYFKLCKEYTRLSLADIGSSVNMDHATVLHAINNVFPMVIQHDRHLSDLYEDYRFSHKHDIESIFENYSRLLRENIELRNEIKDVKESESLLDRRFIDLYNEIPKQKINDVCDKLDVIVKVAKAFHERDTIQS